ncbi:MAG: GH36 C-terminal domain-containing protein, partial [Clostridia bacterium]|nr:GH36 C-terminal domain-containing protein [Clostridia bacterium]
KTAIGMIMQELVQPNTKSHMYFAKGLDPKVVYNFSSDAIPINIKAFGDLINMIAPVHIKNGGVLQNLLSKVYKMPGESENCAASGDTLMYAGVKLKQAFAGTGINGETRFFPDFASRIYVMKSR